MLGELHAKLRRVAQQALNEQIQTGLLDVVRQCALGLEERFIRDAAASGEAISQLDKVGDWMRNRCINYAC